MHKVLVKIFLIVSIFFMACTKEQDKTEEAVVSTTVVALTKEQVSASKIIVGSATEKKMGNKIVANGVIDVPPQYKASISTVIGGFVKSTEVLEGDHVHQGEVLAVLAHPDYIQLQQQFLELKSRQYQLEKELVRQKELREENINSQKKLQEAEADMKIATAQVKALEAKLKMIGLDPEKIADGNISSTIQIRSPITGHVSVVSTSLGKFVKPEEPMFEVISKEHLHLELKVFEKDVLKINEGQRVIFTAGNDEVERNAKIILVGKQLDPQTRAVSIHAHPVNGSEGLLPGMYIKATIIAEEKTATSLPEEALIKEGDTQYIFVKTGEDKGSWVFKKMAVETGMSESGFVEILSPELQPYQASIITQGAYYINAQMTNQGEEE